MSNNRYKILIIEDEKNIRDFIKTFLVSSDYQVLEAENIKDGKMLSLSHPLDLIILDLGLPDGDGLDFIEMVRGETSVPIIVLSARTDEKDKVAALDLGANDYVTKPFGTAELLARVRVALRVHYQHTNKGLESDRIFRSNGLEIDFEKRRVRIGEEEIHLTQTEYNIVALLASRPGKVLTYTEIIKEVWRWNDSGSVKKLQVNMANIRKKMGIKPGQNQHISNELGVGYKMNLEE